MGKPNIKMMRIDERLIHGQGQVWLSSLGVNLVIVANDEVSEDSIQQTLMKTVVSKSVGMRFFSIEHTCEIINKASSHQTIFLVCKTPEDALRLIEGGIEVDEINIGNIHHDESKEKITRSISLGEEDKEALRELSNKYGIKFNTRTTPFGNDGSKEIDITEYL